MGRQEWGGGCGLIVWLRDRSGLPWVRISRSRTRLDSVGLGDGLVLEFGLRLRLENGDVRGHWLGRADRSGRVARAGWRRSDVT